MKTNKKGFTLIELLAVIVILAIIALITVPVVIKIIDNAKKGAAENSTYGVLTSAKLFWTTNQKDLEVANNNITFECTPKGKCQATNMQEAYIDDSGNIAIREATVQPELELEGTKPTGGQIIIHNVPDTGVQYQVVNLKYGDYLCNKTEVQTKVECSATPTTANSSSTNTH